jgi:hypothetical protein
VDRGITVEAGPKPTSGELGVISLPLEQWIHSGAGLALELGEINVLGFVTLVHILVHGASSLRPGRYIT